MGKLERIAEIAGDRRWWSFYLQRRVSNPTYRAAFADRLARLRPAHQPSDPACAVSGSRDLSGAGLHELGKVLSTEKASELVRYFEKKKARDPYRTAEAEFFPLSKERPPAAHIAHHSASDILNAPGLLSLANDPRILDIVGDFLGCKPTIGYIAAWWSYSTGLGPQQAENFHRDVDDWRFVKLFVYLTDVNAENGPHQYVEYSAQQKKLIKIGRFKDSEVTSTFGHDNVRTMTSEAGKGFLENTYGVHKGQPVQVGHRLLFQVVYSMNPLPYAPKFPVMDMPSGADYDPWINRVYLK